LGNCGPCVSLFIAQPLADALGQAMFEANLDYSYNISAVLVWLAVIVMISVVASVVPARNATQVSVRDSLAYQ
jgi:putative ABC transport system permease protein